MRKISTKSLLIFIGGFSSGVILFCMFIYYISPLTYIEWETIFAAALALLAAALTGWLLNEQNLIQRRNIVNIEARNKRAARAALPLVVAEFWDYYLCFKTECIAVMKNHSKGFVKPARPSVHAVTIFHQAARDADESAAELIEEFLAFDQIFEARTADVDGKSYAGLGDGFSLSINSAESIYTYSREQLSRLSDLFAYARSSYDQAKGKFDDKEAWNWLSEDFPHYDIPADLERRIITKYGPDED